MLNYLSNSMGISKENSPFTSGKKVSFNKLKDDKFYKFIVSDTPYDIPDMIGFCEKVIEKSNKIILLDRKNIDEQVESYSFKKYKYGNDVSKYHIREKYEILKEEDCLKYKKEIEEQKNVLSIISRKFNKKIYFYEDIFYGNSLDELCNDLKIDINNNYKNLFLSNFNKERVFNTKESLL